MQSAYQWPTDRAGPSVRMIAEAEALLEMLNPQGFKQALAARSAIIDGAPAQI